MAPAVHPMPLYQILRGTRHRPLLPHRLLAPMRELLIANAEIFDAYASTYDDARWSRAATAVRAAADCLRDVSR